MKLSIIIPIYNVEKYIERCAESVLNQNVPPSQYEVIFVNDGTKDNSVEILKKAIDFNIPLIPQHYNLTLFISS